MIFLLLMEIAQCWILPELKLRNGKGNAEFTALDSSVYIIPPPHSSQLLYIIWIWAVVHKTTGKQRKNLRPVSPYCPHSLDFPCTKWLPRNTQEAQTFLPCYWSVTRWRSLLLNWKRCLLFSLQDFPCQQIKNLDAELQLFLPWNDKFFVSIYYYEKVGHLKENIFIKRKKKKKQSREGLLTAPKSGSCSKREWCGEKSCLLTYM